ncbi:MAG: hypothetical protein C0392_08460 [Syntrophus sp. (in: bacteria)]|nr:hypothetical protein [Syntrophus sp. (in: bacteria)]
MGVTVRQKQPGKGNAWWVFINHQGKRKAKLTGDKKAAEKVASAIREKLIKGELNIAENTEIPTLEKYAGEWLEGYVKASLKDSTYSGYETFMRLYILPALGNKRLDEVSRGDVKNLLFSVLKKNLSARQAFNIKACLSGIFSNAVEEEILKVNPVSRTGKFIRRTSKDSDLIGHAIEFLTKEEVSLLVMATQTYFPNYYPLLLCAVRTGMRIVELVGLEWGDIDFNGRFIEVRRGVVKGIVTTPKNGKPRRIDMSVQLSETLKALKLQRKKDALRQGSIRVTVDTYGHLVPGSNKAAVDKLDDSDATGCNLYATGAIGKDMNDL